MIDLSIIILSYNTVDLLRNCLKSIFSNGKNLNFEIIVLDNASKDESPKMVKKEFPKVQLIISYENLGFAKGNNRAAKIAKGKYILFLNSDTVVKENALGEMVNYLSAHPETDVLGPKLLNSDGSVQESIGFFPNLDVVFKMLFLERIINKGFSRTSGNMVRPADWVMGAAIMIKKEVFEKVGGFDEEIFMYYDEVELCYRLRKQDYQIEYYPEAEIVHLWQRSSTSGREGPILANYKSLIYFYKKHKSVIELQILKIMLKKKAALAIFIGYLTNNRYLKETYEKAFKLV